MFKVTIQYILEIFSEHAHCFAAHVSGLVALADINPRTFYISNPDTSRRMEGDLFI